MSTPDNSFPERPPQCRRCPRLDCVLNNIIKEEQVEQRLTTRSIKFRNRAEHSTNVGYSVASESSSRILATASLKAYEGNVAAKRAYAEHVEVIAAQDCPGTTRGSDRGGLRGIVDYVLNKQICNNPNN